MFGRLILISGTILDDRPIRVDFDWGFQEGRQWGRGRSGGQVISLVVHPFILRFMLVCDLIYIFFPGARRISY